MEAAFPFTCPEDNRVELSYILAEYNFSKRYATLRLELSDGEIINSYSFDMFPAMTPEFVLGKFMGVKNIEKEIYATVVETCKPQYQEEKKSTGVSSLSDKKKIIIETPNIDDALIKKYYCKSFQDFTFWSNHVFLYSMNSLEKLLEDCGLSLVWKKYIQRYPVSNHLYWLSQSLPGGHEKFNELNSCIIEKEYERLLANDGACDTLLVCAEKVM